MRRAWKVRVLEPHLHIASQSFALGGVALIGVLLRSPDRITYSYYTTILRAASLRATTLPEAPFVEMGTLIARGPTLFGG